MILTNWLTLLKRRMDFIARFGSLKKYSRRVNKRRREPRKLARQSELLENRQMLSGAPIAMVDTQDVKSDLTTTIDVLTNDSDPDGHTFDIVSVDTTGTSGTVVWTSGDTTIDYTAPSAGGTDSFTYTIEDSTGLQSTATATINIVEPTTIYANTFKDSDYDGLATGEAGVSGVNVDFYDAGADGQIGGGDDVLLDTQTSTGAGNVLFSSHSLVAGSYYMVFTPPTSMSAASANQGANDAIDSDIDAQGYSQVFSITPGDPQITNIDAGMVDDVTSTVYATTFNDSDFDGKSTSESGLGGVNVDFYDAGADGQIGGGDDTLIDTQTSTGGGNVLFENYSLVASSYYLVFTPPASKATALLNQGSDDTIDSDVDAQGYSHVFSLAPGDGQITNVDAGMVDEVTSTVYATTFNDSNYDGLSTGESGLGGVNVDFYDAGADGQIGGGDDTLIDTQTSTGGGNVLFNNYSLVASSYYLVFTPPASKATALANQGANDSIDSDVDAQGYSHVFSLAPGDGQITNVDAGMVNEITSTIYASAFTDSNSDGLSTGESGRSGVHVDLYDAGADGQIGGGDDTLIDTQTTNGGGNVLFNNYSLVASSYYLVFTPPTGKAVTTADQGSNDAIDSDADAQGFSHVFAIAPGDGQISDVDVGIVDNTAPTVALTNVVTALPEDANTSIRVKVADIVVTDDGSGVNDLTVTGTNASLFEIDGNELFLKAGVVLDHETTSSLTVTVEVDDASLGGSPDDTTALNVSVSNVNEVTAVNDTYITNIDESLVIVPLTNDSDPEADTFSIQSISDPANGTVVEKPDVPQSMITGWQNSYGYYYSGSSYSFESWYNNYHGSNPLTYIHEYTPDAGFVGTDVFNYTIVDSSGATATAAITVSVINQAPVAGNDTFNIVVDQTVTLDLLANDSDADGHTLSIQSVADPANGTVTLETDGSYTYTPDVGYVGTDTFNYTVVDSLGATTVATVTINVTQAPIAVNDTYNTGIDESVVIAPLVNDSDPDGHTFSIQSIADPANGTVVLKPDVPQSMITGWQNSMGYYYSGSSYSFESWYNNYHGSNTLTYLHEYTPDVGFVGDDVFNYTIVDSTGATATAAITVSVINQVPVAGDDTYNIIADETITLDLLANDTDPEGHAISIQSVGTPTNGTVTLETDGSYSYTPNTSFVGTDTFNYTVVDALGATTVAAITIVISDLPGETLDAAQDVALTPAVPVNIAQTVGDGAQGTSDVDFYKVTLGQNETIKIDLDAQDMPGGGSLSSLDSYVRVFNSAGNQVTFNDNEQNPGGLVSYDSYLKYKATTAGTYYIAVSGSGNQGYNANTFGSGTAGSTGDYELNLTLQLPPGFNETSYTVDVPENAWQNFVVDSPAQTDPENGTVSFWAFYGDGPFNINSNGEVYVTSNPTLTQGQSYFLEVVQSGDIYDDFGNYVDYYEDYATVNINVVGPVNATPVGNNDTYGALSNTVLNVSAANGVLSNDTDANGDVLTATLLTDVSNGTLTLNADGSFDYTPTANYVGSDSFTYETTDGNTTSDPVTVTISVTQAPVAVADSYSTDKDVPVVIAPLVNDSDPDGHSISIQSIDDPANGTVVLKPDVPQSMITGWQNSMGYYYSGSSYSFENWHNNYYGSNPLTYIHEYTPDAGYEGNEVFNYTIVDSTGATASASITVIVGTGSNVAPVTADDAYTTLNDAPLNVDAASGVLNNDSDANNDPMTVALVTNASNGTLTLNADGSFDYTANTGFVGTDTFTYEVSDGTDTSAVATVTITVDAPPIVFSTDDTISVYETDTVTIDVLTNDVHPNSETFSIVAVSAASLGTVNWTSGDTTIDYTSTGGLGTDTFTYTVEDANGEQSTSTVTVTVETEPNIDPVANDDTATTLEYNAVDIDVVVNDSDANLVDTISVDSVDTTGTVGNVTINPDGTVNYDPNGQFDSLNDGETATDTFSYTLTDLAGATSVATVTVTITGATAPPSEIEINEGFINEITSGTSTIDFGSVVIGTGQTRIFTIANEGIGDLTLDLASLTIPAGYGVIQDFAEVVAPGTQTTLMLELIGDEVGTYAGTVSFTNNDADEGTFSFDVTGTVTADVGQVAVFDFGLDNDTGDDADDKITTDATITGVVRGNFGTNSVTIEFDQNGDGTFEDSVTVAASGDTFTYDPTISDSSLGLRSIAWRTVSIDANSNTVTSPVSHFAFHLKDNPLTGAPRVHQMELERDTGTDHNDGVTITPILEGIIYGDFQGGTVTVEFDHNHTIDPNGNGTDLIGADGVADGSVVITNNDAFTYDPRTIDTALVGYIGAVNMKYRIIHTDANSQVVSTSNWEDYDFTLEALPASESAVIGFGQTEIDGEIALTGSVAGLTDIALVQVEFDYDEDGIVDASVITDAQGEFTYVPVGLGRGTHTVKARVQEWDPNYATHRTSIWTTATITSTAPEAAEIDSLTLDPAGATTAPTSTANPVIVGQLADQIDSNGELIDIPVSGVTVEFVQVTTTTDPQTMVTTETETVLGTAITDSDGSFEFAPTGLTSGSVTIRANATRFDLIDGSTIDGSTTDLTFTLVAPSIATVTELALLNDTGDNETEQSDNITTDARITGLLSGDGDLSGVSLEINQGDSLANRFTTIDSDGRFVYTPTDLVAGTQTIQVRALQWDAYSQTSVAGAWETITFDWSLPVHVASTISEFEIINDTGTEDDDVTSDPSVRGVVTGGDGQLVAYGVVEIQFTNDQSVVVTEQTLTDAYGNFDFTPQSLPVGSVTVEARVREYDYSLQQEHIGAWQVVAFDLVTETSELPVVTELGLLSDSGTSDTDDITANKTLTGLVEGHGDLGGLAVEFDFGNNGSVDLTAFVDADGKFQATPAVLDYGVHTVVARVLRWDATTGASVASAWSTAFSFTYESQTNVAPRLFDIELKNDTDTEADNITTDPTITGRITNEGSVAGVKIEVRYTDDNSNVVIKQTLTDSEGKFEYTPEDLPIGSVSVEVRTSEYDAATNTQLESAWTTFAFTLNAETVVPNVVATLGLLNDTDTEADNITTDPTLTGTVTGDDFESGLLIEFDHNGDDLIDGSTYADDTGSFEYSPAGLENGSKTVRARVKEYDENGAAVFSAWTSFTFTLNEEAPTTAFVQNLTLANDNGNSSTDKSTSDATITGTVGGPDFDTITDAQIEVDVNGDYSSDQTFTQSGTGQFTFTPTGLNEGRNTIRFRTTSPDGETSSWKELTFIYSSDPDGTTAQDQATALATYETETANNESAYETEVDTIATDLQLAQQNAENTHTSVVSGASAALQAEIDQAQALYESQLEAAQAAYETERSAAESTFLANVGTSDSDGLVNPAENNGSDPSSVGADLEELPELLDPFADEEPEPPVEDLNYDGPAFDFSKSPTYQNAIAQAESDYNEQKKIAADILAAALAAAEAAYNSVTNTADETLQTNIKIHDQDERIAILPAIGSSNTDVTAYYDTLQQDFDAYQDGNDSAEQMYEILIAIDDSTFESELADLGGSVDFEGNVNFSDQTLQEVYDALSNETFSPSADPDPNNGSNQTSTDPSADDQRADFATLIAESLEEKAKADEKSAINSADNLLARQDAKADNLATAELAVIDGKILILDQQADDKHQVASDRALSKEAHEKALAEATRAKKAAIAQAQHAHDLAVANAEKARAIATATAEQVAITTWDTRLDTDWTQYHKELADQKVDYVTDTYDAWIAFETTRLDLVRDNVVAQALEEKAWENLRIELNRDRETNLADNNRDLAKNKNAEQKTREHGEVVAFKTKTKGGNSSRHSRSSNEAGAKRIRVGANASAGANFEKARLAAAGSAYAVGSASNGSSNAEMLLSGTGDAAKGSAISGLHAQMDMTNAQALHDFNTSMADALLGFENGLGDADKDYRVSTLEAEADEGINNAGHKETRDHAISDQVKSREELIASATHTFKVNNATRVKANADSVANASKTYQDALALAQKTLTIDNAVSLKDFQNSVAADRVATLTAWDATVDTPWSQFILDVAINEQTRITALNNAYVANTTAVANAVYAFATFESTEYKTEANTIALAEFTLEVALADAEKAKAEADAASQNAATKDRATHIKTKTNGAVTATKDFKNASANARKQIQEALSQEVQVRSTGGSSSSNKKSQSEGSGRVNKTHAFSKQFQDMQDALEAAQQSISNGGLTGQDAMDAIDAALGTGSGGVTPAFLTAYNNAINAANSQIGGAQGIHNAEIAQLDTDKVNGDATAVKGNGDTGATNRQTRVNALAAAKSQWTSNQNAAKVTQATQNLADKATEAAAISAAYEAHENAITLATQTRIINVANEQLTNATTILNAENAWATTLNTENLLAGSADQTLRNSYQIAMYTELKDSLDAEIAIESTSWNVYQRDMAIADINRLQAQNTARATLLADQNAAYIAHFAAQQLAETTYQLAVELAERDYVVGQANLEIARVIGIAAAEKDALLATNILSHEQRLADATAKAAYENGSAALDGTLNAGLAADDVTHTGTKTTLEYDIATGNYDHGVDGNNSLIAIANQRDVESAAKQGHEIARHTAYQTVHQAYHAGTATNAETRQADLAAAETAELTAKNLSQNAYETAMAALDTTYETAVYNASVAYSASYANADIDLLAALADATIDYLTALLPLNLGAEQTDVVNDYRIAKAQEHADELAAEQLASPSDQNELNAEYAQAQVGYLTALASSSVSYSNAVETAEISRQIRELTAQKVWDVAIAELDRDTAEDYAELERTTELARLARDQAYEDGQRSREQVYELSLLAAAHTLKQSKTATEGDRLEDRADDAWKIKDGLVARTAINGNTTNAEFLAISAQTDAVNQASKERVATMEKVHDQADATADDAYKKAVANAEKQRVIGNAVAEKNYDSDQANADHAYELAAAAIELAYSTAIATHYSTYTNALTSSNSLYDTDSLNADLDWFDDIYLENKNAMGVLDTAVDNDLTAHMKEMAEKENGWWLNTARALVITNANAVSAAYNTFETGLTALELTQATTIANRNSDITIKQADANLAASLTVALETERDETAAANAAYDKAVGNSDAEKIRTQDLKDHDYYLALGEKNGQVYDVVAYNADVTATEVTYQTSILTVETTDQSSITSNSGTSDTEYAQINIDYYDETLGTIDGNGDLVTTDTVTEEENAIAAADKAYELGVAALEKTLSDTLAGLTKSLDSDLATTYETAIHTLAAGVFNDRAKSKATAAKNKAISNATDYEAYELDLNAEFETSSITNANANHDLDVSTRDADVKTAIAYADADLDDVINTAADKNNLANSGGTVAVPLPAAGETPDVIYQPFGLNDVDGGSGGATIYQPFNSTPQNSGGRNPQNSAGSGSGSSSGGNSGNSSPTNSGTQTESAGSFGGGEVFVTIQNGVVTNKMVRREAPNGEMVEKSYDEVANFENENQGGENGRDVWWKFIQDIPEYLEKLADITDTDGDVVGERWKVKTPDGTVHDNIVKGKSDEQWWAYDAVMTFISDPGVVWNRHSLSSPHDASATEWQTLFHDLMTLYNDPKWETEDDNSITMELDAPEVITLREGMSNKEVQAILAEHEVTATVTGDSQHEVITFSSDGNGPVQVLSDGSFAMDVNTKQGEALVAGEYTLTVHGDNHVDAWASKDVLIVVEEAEGDHSGDCDCKCKCSLPGPHSGNDGDDQSPVDPDTQAGALPPPPPNQPPMQGVPPEQEGETDSEEEQLPTYPYNDRQDWGFTRSFFRHLSFGFLTLPDPDPMAYRPPIQADPAPWTSESVLDEFKARQGKNGHGGDEILRGALRDRRSRGIHYGEMKAHVQHAIADAPANLAIHAVLIPVGGQGANKIVDAAIDLGYGLSRSGKKWVIEKGKEVLKGKKARKAAEEIADRLKKRSSSNVRKGTPQYRRMSKKQRQIESELEKCGNRGVSGSVSASEADYLGEKFVGSGFTERLGNKGERILISEDGLRIYRGPTKKPGAGKFSLTGTQANFGSRCKPSGQWENNVHLDINDK